MRYDILEQLKRIKHKDIVDKQWLLTTRQRLQDYIVATPGAITTAMPTARWRVWGMIFRPAPIMLAFVIVLTVGASMAAGSTLPGDALYPWKVSINENVKLALTKGEADRIEYQIEKVSKRFTELTELAFKPMDDLNVIAEANAKAGVQLEETEKAIEELGLTNDEAALDATVKLKAALDTQKAVIDHIENVAPEQGDKLVESQKAIKKSVDGLEQKSIDLVDKQTQNDLKTDPLGSTEGRVKGAQDKLEKTASVVSIVENGDILTGSAKEKIQAATEALNNAEIALLEADYERALTYVQASLELTAGARALAGTATQVSKDVKSVLEEDKNVIAVIPVESIGETPLESQTQDNGNLVERPINLPFGEEIILSVKTDKLIYKTGDPVQIIIEARNENDKNIELNWNTACQTAYTISDVFDSQSGLVCAQVLTTEIIPQGESIEWSIAHEQELEPGKYLIKATLLGYGLVATEIEVLNVIDGPEILEPEGDDLIQIQNDKIDQTNEAKLG
ncbi:MAG: BsuPI-related putative proteinase inhibitor [Parcubacteria group bacterium]